MDNLTRINTSSKHQSQIIFINQKKHWKNVTLEEEEEHWKSFDSTDEAKTLLQLIDTHLTPASKSHKIFNRNTIKVSRSWTQKMLQFMRRNHKKVKQIERYHCLECDCWIKTECPLTRDFEKEDVIYNNTALPSFCSKKSIHPWCKMSYKNKKFTTTLNRFEMIAVSTVQFPLVMSGKQTKNETPSYL